MVGIYYAFTSYDFAGGLFGSPFVGLDNFKFLTQSGILLKLTINTLGYNVVFIILGNAVSIGAAILLSEVRGKLFKSYHNPLCFYPTSFRLF